MKVSIFTPTHNSKWLREAYESIKDQPFDEWIVVYSQGADVIDFGDDRIKQFILPDSPPLVGYVKRFACAQATGDILIELDHDDMLLPGAIDEIRGCFAEHPDVGFVYSDTIGFSDGSEGPESAPQFDPRYGWEYYPVEWRGRKMSVARSFPPSPASVSRIWYAPDHVRAFRRDVYEQVGGYNPDMRVLDDQDLMCRLYQVAKFHHIEKALYAYRHHDGNTFRAPDINAEIQTGTMRLYDKYIESMALKWARDRGLLAVDLGGRINSAPGYTTVDTRDAAVIADLNGRWPFGDGTVGVVRAFDVFEHLRDPVHTMTELYRVLAPGGYAFIQVPSTDGRGAFQDPTHVSFWNENSFLYYTDDRWNQYIDCPVRFQALRRYTTEKNNIGVCWIVAHLCKIDDQNRMPGEILI